MNNKVVMHKIRYYERCTDGDIYYLMCGRYRRKKQKNMTENPEETTCKTCLEQMQLANNV